MKLLSAFYFTVLLSTWVLSQSSLEQLSYAHYQKCMGSDRSLPYSIYKLGVQKLYAQDSSVCKDKIIIVNFTQASSKKRFYFIDLQNAELLLKTYVSHGKNSGDVYPTKFSNIEGSFQSSLGVYHTSETYCGDHDLSIRLDGLDKYKNSNARMRDIVIHRAEYANESYLKTHGKLGRSLGCLAIPENVTDEMIEKMSAGVVIYVYGRNR